MERVKGIETLVAFSLSPLPMRDPSHGLGAQASCRRVHEAAACVPARCQRSRWQAAMSVPGCSDMRDGAIVSFRCSENGRLCRVRPRHRSATCRAVSAPRGARRKSRWPARGLWPPDGRTLDWERWHPAGVERGSSCTRRQDAGAPGGRPPRPGRAPRPLHRRVHFRRCGKGEWPINPTRPALMLRSTRLLRGLVVNLAPPPYVLYISRPNE